MASEWRYDIEVTISAKAQRRVVILAYDDMELLDVAGPANVLTAASRLTPGAPGYAVELVAVGGGKIVTAGGIELVARRAARNVRGAIDTVLVPGGVGTGDGGRAVVPHLVRLAKRARRVVGVCSGAFILGEAGLLEGRRAATHWAVCDLLAQRHPGCQVDADAIYVRDGRVWTSAGVTAGMDLALALVEADHGAELALEVARWLVLYLRRPGGQSQFSAPLAAQFAQRSSIQKLVGWVRDNLRADLSVAALAERAGMSERNFARVFTDEIGETPAAWVQRARLERARSALETSRQSVKEIAAACGYTTTETMQRAFKRELGATPLAYRERFRV